MICPLFKIFHSYLLILHIQLFDIYVINTTKKSGLGVTCSWCGHGCHCLLVSWTLGTLALLLVPQLLFRPLFSKFWRVLLRTFIYHDVYVVVIDWLLILLLSPFLFSLLSIIWCLNNDASLHEFLLLIIIILSLLITSDLVQQSPRFRSVLWFRDYLLRLSIESDSRHRISHFRRIFCCNSGWARPLLFE